MWLLDAGTFVPPTRFTLIHACTARPRSCPFAIAVASGSNAGCAARAEGRGSTPPRRYESPSPRTWTRSVLKPLCCAAATISSMACGDVRLVRTTHRARTSSRACRLTRWLNATTRPRPARPAHRLAGVNIGKPESLYDLKKLPQARFDVFADRIADEVVRLAQARQRLRVRQPGLLHHDRCFDVPPRAAQQFIGFVVFKTRHDRHDATGAVASFFGAGLHIDHQVAVRLAGADHRARRQHVEDDLRGRSGFEPRGSGNHLGPDGRRDRQIDEG